MSKREDVAAPEKGVDVHIQPLPHPSRPSEAAAPRPVLIKESPYPYPPTSAGMPTPQDLSSRMPAAAAVSGGDEASASAAALGGGTGDSSSYPTAAEAAAAAAAAAEARQQQFQHQTMQSTAAGPEGDFISRPPPQVMTALGPMPLPPEIRKRIPEKFVARPIIEEREIYIAKKEVQERTIEVPHVHYEHKFAEVARSLKIKKIVPTITEVIKEVPREVYKPVIEEKVIEVPQGVKYVEVPVEVPCLYPPKIVPRPKVQVVQRVVETIKPVVKEKVIEVPQTIVKQIPKIKTVEVPYYVPRYVEKIIEVPYQPPDAASLPPILSGTLPAGIAAQMPLPFQMGPMPLSQLNSLNLPYEAKVDVKVSQETPPVDRVGLPPSGWIGGGGGGSFQRSATLVSGDGNQPAIELVEGFKWGKPPNAPPLGPTSPFCIPPPLPAGGGGAGSSRLGGGVIGGSHGPAAAIGAAAPDGDPRMRHMPPLMVTCPPEVGQVNFAGFVAEPDILTRMGVISYSGFRSQGNFQMLFPPLAPQPGVPLDPTGAPDVKTIDETHQYVSGSQRTGALEKKAEEIEKMYEEDGMQQRQQQLLQQLVCCGHNQQMSPHDNGGGVVYEQ